MKLYYETVSPILKSTLSKLFESRVFKDFTLVGGTCLSLQLGHRISIDIDLFTDIDYGSMDTSAIKDFLQKSFAYTENLDALDKEALGYSLFVGTSPVDKVKLDLFYTDKFIFRQIEQDGIILADKREIAAMKLEAITDEEPRKKDFWDIYELSNQYSFEEMLEWAIKRNEYVVSKESVIAGFDKIDDVEDIDVISLGSNYWELIKEDLKEIISVV